MIVEGSIAEEYRLAAEEWVDADNAANLLEECKSAILSQKMLALGEMPVSRAEMMVKGSEDWMRQLVKMVDARAKANQLKVKVEYLRMRFMEQNSHEATRRAEMKL